MNVDAEVDRPRITKFRGDDVSVRRDGLVWIKRLLVLGLLTLGALRPALALTTTQDATITVTPVADVTLTLNTTTYAFGSVSVNSSTSSITALRLTNSGQVNVTVDKRIATQSNPVGWTAGTTPGLDTYVIYCATSTAQLSLSSFGAATQFGIQGNVTPLTGPGGTSPIMPTQGTGSFEDLWFRLDMPTTVSSIVSRSITVRFTGTAQ
jgi:hypothetical protein